MATGYPRRTGSDPNRGALFDVEHDPATGELVNVARPADVERLTARLRTYATIGDSHTGLAVGTNENATDRLSIWPQLISGDRWRLVRNGGVSGQTSAQMLARIGTDVLSQSPDVVLIMAGTNDAAASVPLATFAANMTAMIAAARDAGAVPVVLATPPRASARSFVSQYLAWEWEYCRRNGILFVDTHTPVVDAATGGIAAAYDSGDALHVNDAARQLWGQAIVDALATPVPRTAYVAPANNDPRNLLTNGLFLTDSNSDGLPDNWLNGVPASTTVSLVAGTDGLVGQWLNIVATGSTSRTVYQLASTSVSTGDRLMLSGFIDVNTAGGALWSPFVRTRKADNAITAEAFAFFRLGIVYPVGAGKVAFAAEVTVPASTTRIDAGMLIEGTTGEGRMGQLTLTNLTALGLA